MKVKKINLISYNIEVPQLDGTKKSIPYDVRNSLGEIILAPQLKLNGTRLLKNQKIASKIIDCKEDFILLELGEWSVLHEAVEILDVFGKNDVELIQRILESVDVDVEEKH
jgi:hypothetical protein